MLPFFSRSGTILEKLSFTIIHRQTFKPTKTKNISGNCKNLAINSKLEQILIKLISRCKKNKTS